MRPYHCTHCHHVVFFDNSQCQPCGSALGFWPEQRRMVALQPGAAGSDAWRVRGRGVGVRQLKACANRLQHQACNWMLDVTDPHDRCLSCRLNVTVPNLSDPAQLERWARVERAKRRMCYTLLGLGLMPEPKTSPADRDGLSFEILAPMDGQPVLTGHADGVITLNLMEADDLHRETARVSFDEPWRTLLGHLRHEVSHYLQHRWIASDPAALQRWRDAFGDERADYGAALARHHAGGPVAGWEAQYISAYASSHPHEDWAETCAHLLLVIDAVETASAWGLALSSRAARARPTASGLADPVIDDLVLRQWLPVAQFLNAMNRSLGLPDSYPFQMPTPVVQKMSVAAQLLREAAARHQKPPPAVASAPVATGLCPGPVAEPVAV